MPSVQPTTPGSPGESTDNAYQLFRRQARATPDAPALGLSAVDPGQRAPSMSYGELAARVEAMAQGLRRGGLGVEEVVGVSLERSPEAIVATLAVLAAGGAYLPLDPAYPAPRRRYMIEDSGCRRVISRADLATGLGEAQILDVDTLGSTPPVPESGDREALGGPDDLDRLAYVIYTSGSTGRPKGVLIAHRGLLGVVADQRRLLGVGAGKRVLQFASPSFDAAIFELFLALASGAYLCLARQERLLPGPDLVELLREERITHAVLPPSVLAAVPEAQLPDLECLTCAGEALPGSLAARWAPARRLFNLYGPTETTIWVTAAAVTAKDERPAIGTAVAGAALSLMDPHLEAVPEGEVGELLIGGPGVARGYLGRPALTAERFIPDALATYPGARCYRTGDLARRREDGQVEFRGRRDHQVKIRGLRIELGEVEAELAAHPGVEAAAAAVADDGTPRLLAWAVAAKSGVAAQELRTYLAQRLPRHMVPDELTLLDRLPLTANGKLDRAALPRPETSLRPSGRALETPEELRLAPLWCELLGLDEVRADDDFFALGGHSLVVGQLISRVRRDLGAELDLQSVFEASSLETMAARIAARRQQSSPAPSTTPPVPPPIERLGQRHGVPLSFPQERVWFLDRLVRGNIAYNAQATVELEGPLQPSVLERVLEEIVARHEIFRTTFREDQGRGVQDVHPPAPLTLPLIDLRRIPEAQRRGAAEAIVAAELARPFHLGQLPLARWTLLRLAPERHLLIQVEHHFVHDGWAFAVLMGEIKTLYQAFARDLPSPLPEPPVQYTDFALWQRRWLDGPVLEQHLDVWQRLLKGLPPALELPTDHPRPKAQTFRGAGPRVELDGELADALRAFSREQGVTLFATMAAGFYALLHRYTGATDIPLGSAMANRPLPELEAMPGMVVNTMVLRADLGGDPSFAELVRRVRRNALEAWAYQSVPLEKLVAKIAPDRDLSRNPLFQAMFSFHDSPVPDLDLDLPEGTLRGKILERHNGSAKNDLNVVVIPRGEQRLGREPRAEDRSIVLIWEYSTDLFEADTIERMIGHYRTLLRDAVGHPRRPLSQLALLTPGEQSALDRWQGGSQRPDFHEAAVLAENAPHLLVVGHARRDPGAPAVTGGGGSLSYGELERRSAALAAQLRRRGVGSEVPVALLCPRSPELVLAALAVLRAGGAFVPLDPEAPAERQAALVRASGAPLVLAHRDFQHRLQGLEVPVLTVDVAAETIGSPGIGIDLAPDPEQLAYVIFTSGSTGVPKAVAVPHRGFANLCGWHRETFEIGPWDRFSVVANPAFDASVWEIWSQLAAGAELVIPDDAVRLSAHELWGWLRQECITRCFLPTPLAEALLDEIEAGAVTDEAALPALRTLFAGGDRLRRFPPAALGCRFENHYGPTEAAVITVAATVPVVPDGRSPAIGRPIANTRTYVLDGRLRRLPKGIPGDLYLAGASLARGYLDSPRLTAERYRPDPWSRQPGERMYRTGDQARWRRDRQLDCLGRTDHQVKVRGFRIELGEIEAALKSHPAIREAVVVGVDATAGKALAAYAVSAGETPLDTEAILADIGRRLPAYMLPAVLMELDALPLTHTGKVDRRALPAPVFGAGSAYLEPETEMEELLAELWGEVLERDRIGAADNFFDLGGHSLLAARILARLREDLEVEIPLHAFFEAPTVRRLAVVVEDRLLAEA